MKAAEIVGDGAAAPRLAAEQHFDAIRMELRCR